MSEKSALGNSFTSGILSRSPQSTRAPSAAASWTTEYSGMTVSKPTTSCPARASSAMASALVCASGKDTPAFSISPWQAMEVGLPAAGRGPRRPPNMADMTRLCELSFICVWTSAIGLCDG